MPCQVDGDLLESEICLGEELCDMELGYEGMEGSSEGDGIEDEEEREWLEEHEVPAGKDGEMIESYDKREMITAMVVEDTIDPYEGMEFDSEGAAREFYCSYARRVGFRVRVSKCRRSSCDGTVICRRFVCCNYSILASSDCGNPMQTPILSGVGCTARLVVKKQNSGKWLVTKFKREHGHVLVAPRRVELKSHIVNDVKKIVSPNECLDCPKEEVTAVQPQRDPSLEPFEGMEFQSEEAARMFYYEYGKDLGFTVRISKCRRAKDGTMIYRRFVCSKEGYYVRKYGRTKRSRALTRVGCMARLVVKKLDSGVWIVTNFAKEHNHPTFVVGILGKEPSHRPPPPSSIKRINCGSLATLEVSSGSISSSCELNSPNTPNSVTWRFNKLHQEGIKFAEEGASSVEAFNVAMLALRESMQKVIAAKKSVVRDSEVRTLVSSCNKAGDGNELMLVNISSVQETTSRPPISEDLREVVSQGGPMLTQQSLDLMPTGPKLQNGPDQVPVSNAPNGQNLQGSFDNTTLNGIDSLSDQASLRNKLANRNIMAVTRRNRNPGGCDTGHLEGSRFKNQAWNSVCGVTSSVNGNLVALSDAQMAALQAVEEAFSTPTAGAPSSSEVSPVPTESSGSNNSFSNELLRTPQHHCVPNPLVHAAAVAAGARIISPAAAASLIKAVQSNEAVHIRAGQSIPKLPTRSRNLISVTVDNTHKPTPSASGMQFQHTRELLPAAVPIQDNRVLDGDGDDVVEMTMDVQGDLLHLKAGEDWLMDQYQVGTDNGAHTRI